MKMMKNLLALMLTIALAMGCMTTAFASSDEWINFEPQLCNIFEMPVSEWMSTEFNRALATVCIWLDIATSDTFTGDIKIYGTSYIGADDSFIFVSLEMQDANKAVFAMYSPAAGTASYKVYPVTGTYESQMTYMMNAMCPAGYHTNSYSAISDVISMLSDALSD